MFKKNLNPNAFGTAHSVKTEWLGISLCRYDMAKRESRGWKEILTAK